MGLLDLRINVERGSRWKGRNRRIAELRTKTVTNSVPSDPSANGDNNPTASNTNDQTNACLIVQDHGKTEFMDPELYQAATRKDVDGFINILERISTEKGLPLSAIMDWVSPLGNTLLHVAASITDNAETVGLISYHFPSIVLKKNSKGDTALHVAARTGDYVLVSAIIRPAGRYSYLSTAIKDLLPKNKKTAIEGPVREMSPDDLLPRVRNEEGNTALHEAWIYGHREAAYDLTKVDPEVLCWQNNEGKSPLYLATEAGENSCLCQIMEREFSRNMFKRLEGKSPVLAAIMKKNSVILKILLKNEPRFIHSRDEEGRSPFHLAASIGYLEGVRYMLGEYPSGAVEGDKNGLFPVHLASIEGHVDVIEELLKHCLDPRELLDPNDQNILHFAAKAGKLNVVNYVLEAPKLNGLINGRDKDGKTPLHLAIMHRHPMVASALTRDKRVEGSCWQGRHRRITELRTRSITFSVPKDPISNGDNNPTTSIINDHTNASLVVQDYGKTEYMDPELYQAATGKDVDGFIGVLERISTEKGLPLSAIIDWVSPLGNTLLHVAASITGNAETVGLISYHFPSIVSKKNSKGDTALHVAARTGDYFLVSTIIHPTEWYSFLFTAIEGPVRDMTSDDFLTRVRNEEGNTALHEAWIYGHRQAADELTRADPEVLCWQNNNGKSPLYLATEAGAECSLSDIFTGNISEGLEGKSPVLVNMFERLEGKSPVLAAIMKKKTGILRILLEYEPRFIHFRDEEGRTPFHLAASIGYLEGVRYMLGKYPSGAVKRDKNGLFPVHLASVKGHVDVIEELLKHCLHPRELLDHNDQSILHYAAKAGKQNVVSYILKTPKFKDLINGRDKDGNTPLHLATMHWHPKVVSALTWDKRVDLKFINKEGLTALDAAEFYMERIASFRKRLTWTALKSAGAPRAPYGKVMNLSRQISIQSVPTNMDDYKERVNTLLLVSTLVATVTFAAGFTLPGGYNNSEPNQGMATMVGNRKFHIFVFCDTIAMYSAILVAVSLIWAQLGDLKMVLTALRLALPLLGVALTMMSLTFMAGVFLVVSNLNWLAYSVLTMGLVFLVVLFLLFLPLCFPISSSRCFLRYGSFYVFQLLMLVTGSLSTDDAED